MSLAHFLEKYSNIQRRYKICPRECSREDSNLHGFPHTVLSRTRLPIPPREPNRWPLQCARASRLQDKTGDNTEQRNSEVTPSVSSVREPPTDVLCVPDQASATDRHSWIQQSHSPSKVYPSPAPTS